MSEWRKSSFCRESNCVEVQLQIDGSVLVRDSKDRNGPWLQFSAAEWDAHEAGIKAELQRKNTAQGLEMANLENLLIQAQMQITRLLAESL